MNNEHGLDVRYFREKLEQLVRDACYYTPEEMELALRRLSGVARQQKNVENIYQSCLKELKDLFKFKI